jgi:peptidoglycan/xylan/chitin deacetylase (PgdA/CDA1 family)
MPLTKQLLGMACDVAHFGAQRGLLPVPKPAGGCVFTLHSVLPDDDVLPKENNHVSRRFLDAAVAYYKKNGIAIVTLDEALNMAVNQRDKPYVCFTFDDGYRDNASLALKIFDKYDAPFTIYITSAALDRSMGEYWWGQLRHVVRDNQHLEIPQLGKTLRAVTNAEKITAYDTIARAIKQGDLSVADADAIFSHYGVTREEALDRDCLTEAELTALAANHSRVQVGAHATRHEPLASLPSDVAASDIADNKQRLERLTGRDIRHFAYPYGDRQSCGPREFDLARKAGFASAVTTIDGNLESANAEARWSIPRRRVLGPVEHLGFLECQRTGLLDKAISVVKRR